MAAKHKRRKGKKATVTSVAEDTRDGTDRQRVIEINDDGDLMLVECIKVPLDHLNEDGSRDKPWCEFGEQEWNLPRRCSYPEELVIEGEKGPSGPTLLKLSLQPRS